jgi:16S rRNA (cytidine1402-2'-O)-methyltransferase
VGTLHLVATPIGNLEDVTLRALRVLREADLLLAEDTRRTRILLERHGIAARPRALHAHNEAARMGEALAALARGDAVCLVCDAGTPLVSDPGERLVAAAISAGHAVVPVPGPSAVLAALSASGLPATPFLFAGFPPRRAGARRALFEGLRERSETLVFFEAPTRVAATLAALVEALGERRACVARELTKLHEELARGSLSELAARFAQGTRGEVTLVVEGARHPARRQAARGPALDERVRALLAAGRTPREVADALAGEGALPRREVYARALALRGTR